MYHLCSWMDTPKFYNSLQIETKTHFCGIEPWYFELKRFEYMHANCDHFKTTFLPCVVYPHLWESSPAAESSFKTYFYDAHMQEVKGSNRSSILGKVERGWKRRPCLAELAYIIGTRNTRAPLYLFIVWIFTVLNFDIEKFTTCNKQLPIRFGHGLYFLSRIITPPRIDEKASELDWKTQYRNNRDKRFHCG